jgi:hypothetical protein
MPVDEEINLNNPDGITQDDIDRMNAQADELERIAEKSEVNAEKVAKAKKQLEGMTFAQQNILDKALDGKSGGGNIGQEQLMELVAEIYEQLEEAKEERKDNKSEIEKQAEEIKKAEAHRRKIEAQIKSGLLEAEGKANEVLGATSNPFGFAKGKLMSYVGKAGIVGVIIGIVYRAVDMVWKEYQNSFKAGGANDIRKMMDDRDREMAELDDILARRSGRVFFTGDVDLRQGAPQFSNTERLRDQVVRYQALHLGE